MLKGEGDIGVEAFAVEGSVEQAGRINPIIAQGGEERRGAPANRPMSRCPFGAQPRRRVIFVFVQVSSTKTRRLGLMSP